MKNQQNPVVITEDDYNLLKPLARRYHKELAQELQRAIIVRKDAFPENTVAINSVVTVEDAETQRTSSFRIVLPSMADIKQRCISVLSPMGTALLGFRKGEEVQWQMPGGLKTIRIIEVSNHATQNNAS
jgi:regulator of nucleoside diphosphate kinase